MEPANHPIGIAMSRCSQDSQTASFPASFILRVISGLSPLQSFSFSHSRWWWSGESREGLPLTWSTFHILQGPEGYQAHSDQAPPREKSITESWTQCVFIRQCRVLPDCVEYNTKMLCCTRNQKGGAVCREGISQGRKASWGQTPSLPHSPGVAADGEVQQLPGYWYPLPPGRAVAPAPSHLPQPHHPDLLEWTGWTQGGHTHTLRLSQFQ